MSSMTSDDQSASNAHHESFGAQAPIALLGLGAIAVIALINLSGRPASATPEPTAALACSSSSFGRVVAVRRSAHSSPVYFVEVQMLDGSTRIVQQLAAGFKVGDVVLVNGNALSLRPQPS